VTQTSLELAAVLEGADPERDAVAGTHQALVFEKLIKSEEEEDEIPLDE